MTHSTSENWQTDMISSVAESKTPELSVTTLPARRASVPARSARLVIQRPKTALDRWENQTSGFGVHGSDPIASTIYSRILQLPLYEIEALYRKDWLTQRIIESLPDAAFQKGFEIKSEKDPKGAEENSKLLKRWKTKTNSKHQTYQGRLYGGAGKINFINDGMPTAMPINWQMIKSVDRTIICGRFYCRPWRFYADPTDLKRFKQPWIYQVFEVTYGMQMPTYYVHEQRLSWMDGTYLPDHLKIGNWGAGDSVLERVHEALRPYGVGVQSVGPIIQDFVTKVLQIENLDDLLEENEEELEYRIRMADARSGSHGTSVIGPDEKIYKISTPVTGLADLIVLLMDTVAAAANTPKSKLFGNLTGTLGSSSGKYDRANWDNQVETFQNEICTPIIEDDLKLACAINNNDFEDMEIVWPDVKEKGEKETAQTRKLNAEAEKIEIENERARTEKTE